MDQSIDEVSVLMILTDLSIVPQAREQCHFEGTLHIQTIILYYAILFGNKNE